MPFTANGFFEINHSLADLRVLARARRSPASKASPRRITMTESSRGSAAAGGDPPSREQTGSPNISWPLERPNTPRTFDARLEGELRARAAINSAAARQNTSPYVYMPEGKKSLSRIAVRAFGLGLALGSCSLLTALAVYVQSRLWRPSFFISSLAFFHFLEFYTTARYNPPMATVSSFLLRNGRAYDIANTAAFVECTVTSIFFPDWQARFGRPYIIALGLVLTATGQMIRSTAMIQAGTNFNHQVQTQRNEGHVLVTDGIYGWLRHPSYFGYFWWGVGTQIVLGNAICSIGFALVLWRFFNHRIRGKICVFSFCQSI